MLPDAIGHGKSSKPSDGLRASFPLYGYLDMVEAQHRLLQELRVDHLRLVMGTSMGGMHTWLWGELHPQYMDVILEREIKRVAGGKAIVIPMSSETAATVRIRRQMFGNSTSPACCSGPNIDNLSA